MVYILSDSQAAIQAVSNMSRGAASPRSGIEAEIKSSLINPRSAKDFLFTWVRGPIGIEGNEKADHNASLVVPRGDKEHYPYSNRRRSPRGLQGGAEGR